VSLHSLLKLAQGHALPHHPSSLLPVDLSRLWTFNSPSQLFHLLHSLLLNIAEILVVFIDFEHEVVGVVHEVLELAAEVSVEGRLQHHIVGYLILLLRSLALGLQMGVSLHQYLLLHLEFIVLFDLLLHDLLGLVQHTRRIDPFKTLLLLQFLLRQLAEILQLCAPAETLKVSLILQNKVDVFRVIVSHELNSSSHLVGVAL
jgi:hypothetical protein